MVIETDSLFFVMIYMKMYNISSFSASDTKESTAGGRDKPAYDVLL